MCCNHARNEYLKITSVHHTMSSNSSVVQWKQSRDGAYQQKETTDHRDAARIAKAPLAAVYLALVAALLATGITLLATVAFR